MRLLVSVAHPAHVHLFKHVAWSLQQRGWEVLIVARDKEITLRLLDEYAFQYLTISAAGKGMWGLGREMVGRVFRLIRIMRAFRPDVVLSQLDPSVGVASRLLGIPYVATADTDHAVLTMKLGMPFATKVLTPECYGPNHGRKQVRYKGYHELAYLHPRYFAPDPSVLASAGLSEGEPFSIVRFVSWQAAHDVGQGGFSREGRLRLVRELARYGRVLVSAEKGIDPELADYAFRAPAHLMHHFLYYASVCVTEGATMASECAVLGTPAVYMNTLSAGTLREQQDRYGLLFNFHDRSREGAAISTALGIAGEAGLRREEWRDRAGNLVRDHIDVTEYILDVVAETGAGHR